MKHTLTTFALTLLVAPAFASAQVSFSSDTDSEITTATGAEMQTQSSEQNTSMQSSSQEPQTEQPYYSTSTEGIVLYQNGKEFKTLTEPDSTTHSAADQSSDSSLPMANVPNGVLVNNADFDIVVGTGSTSSEPEEIVVETTEPLASTTSPISKLVLYAVGAVALIGGAVVGMRFMKKK